MSTIIDELIVRLGLKNEISGQASGVRKDLDDVEKSAQGAESGVKKIGETSKGTAGELSALSGKLGAFLALIGGTEVVKTFVRDTIATNTQLFFLSRNLDMSAQSISAWGIVAREFGGTAEGLQNTLKNLSTEAAQFRLTGQSSLIRYLAMLGIPLTLLRPGDQTALLEAIAQRIAPIAKANRPMASSILEQLDLDEGTINAILAGPQALNQHLAQAAEMARAMDKEAQVMAKVNEQLAPMQTQWKIIGLELLSRATPALQQVVSWLQKFGAWVQQHEDIAATFVAVAIGMSAIGAAATLLSGPLGLAAAAIAAVSAAVAFLRDDYRAWSEGAPSLFDWTAFRDLIHAAGDAFDYLADKIDKATDKYEKWAAAHPKASNTVEDIGKTILEASPLGIFTNFTSPLATEKLAQGIATQEGFYKSGTVPQRANNPGDIEYGPFAKAHGATGSISAEGGKQIAVFRDVPAGMVALVALLEKNYAGMTVADALKKYSPSAPADYIPGVLATSGLSASDIVPRISGSAALRTDFRSMAADLINSTKQQAAGLREKAGQSVTNHFGSGSITIHTLATDAKGIVADMKRALDWTFATQHNSGSR